MKRCQNPSWPKSLAIVFATAMCTVLAAANASVNMSTFSYPAPAAIDNASAGVSTSLRADPGLARSVSIGETIMLDGTGSQNLEGKPLVYSWTLRAPHGSAATLSDPAAVRPRFTVDLLGDYIAELVVSDGDARSKPATVRISTGNVSPVARATHHRHIDAGYTVLLDATDSFDFNGDTLSYRWSVEELPAGSQAVLQAARASIAAFTPDVPGDYVLSLVVNDGKVDSAPARVHLTTQDARPVAAAGADWHVRAGSAVRLDGRDSMDPEGRSLSYQWSLLHAPALSAAHLAGASTAQPVLYTDAAGIYVAQLVVSDGVHADAADTVVIETMQAGPSGGPPQLLGGGSDVDGDGIPDVLDNCPDHPNPTQLDSNGDGFGNRCDPDLDNDGFITNFGDLGLLKKSFFASPAAPACPPDILSGPDGCWNPDADFNGDNAINFIDLGIMKSFFFGPPGPLVVTFVNPAGGDWHDPANWSPPVVPTTIHTVRIDLDPGVEVEYSAGDSEIAGLRATSPVRISGGELSITKEALFDGGLTITSGATLANANILAPTVVPAPAIEIPEFQIVFFDGVALGADLNIQRGSTLTVDNSLILDNATVALVSDNNFTSLVMRGGTGGSSTLGGAGEVLFTGTATVDNRNRIRVSGSGHALSVAPGVSIRTDTTGGELRHDSNNGPITLQGTVSTDLAGRAVSVFGHPLNVEGTVAVSNDSRIQLNFGADGGGIDAGATITVDTGELELFGDFTNDADFTITDGTLDIGNVAADEWDNDGSIALVSSVFEAGGSFTAADVGNISGTGTTFIDGALDNTGQTLDVAAVFPDAVLLITGGSIIGGTIDVTPLTLSEFQSFTLDGVVLSTDFQLERGATATVRNSMTLDEATVTMVSDNNFTSLVFNGATGETSVLGGIGEVLYSGTATVDNRNRIRVSGSNHGLTIAPGVTIRSDTTGGELRHDSNNGQITIQGTVISNLATRSISLFGFPLIIEGVLQVSNDGRIQANFGGVGSTIAASASLSVDTGELELFGNFTNEATITISDGTLDIGNVAGDSWDNNGSIVLDNAVLELGGSFIADNIGNVSGTGTVILNGTLDNTAQNLDLSGLLPGTVQLGSNGSIIGGMVVGTTLTLPEFLAFTLDGVTLSADIVLERGATMTVDNGLTLNNATITMISDNNFTSLVFDGANGETASLAGTGEILLSGSATVDNRNRIRVRGSGHGLTVAAGITIRSDTTGGELRHDSNNGPVTLQGTVIADLASRSVSLFGFPLTVEGTLDVSGDARLQANFGGAGSSIAAGATVTVNTAELELFGDFTNEATVAITDGTLDIGNVAGDEWDNNGSITLANSTVEVGGSFSAADVGSITGTGISILDGALDNTGQVLDLGTLLPGTVLLQTGGSIIGGTVATTPITLVEFDSFTLDGTTLNADLTLERGATMMVDNGLTLDNATITMMSDNNFTSLIFDGANGEVSSLAGTGNILFSGSATVDNRNRIRVRGTGHGLTVAAGITIESDTTGGELRHDSSNGAVTLQGSMISDLASRSVALFGFPLIIEGTLDVSNDARLQANFGGTGSSIAAGATVSVNGAELELFGDFANEATFTVTDGMLDLGNVAGDEWDNNGSITLANSTIEVGGAFTAADIGTIGGTGTTIIDGALDNTGETLDLGSVLPGTVLFGTGGSVIAGTLTTTPLSLIEFDSFTLDGVTLSTNLELQRGSTMNISNGLTLDNATVTLVSDNNFTSLTLSGANGATSTLGGTGEILFSGTATVDNRNRVLVSGAGHALTVAPGVTIRSDTTGGELRHSNNAPIVVQGSIISDLPSRTVTLRGVPLTIEGNLSVGAGSTMALDDYTLAASAELDVDVGGLTAADFGRYTGDAASLAGTLDIALVNGFSPSLGDTFEIMSFNSRSGTFDTENGTGLGGGLSFQVNYNATDVTLEVIN